MKGGFRCGFDFAVCLGFDKKYITILKPGDWAPTKGDFGTCGVLELIGMNGMLCTSTGTRGVVA